LTEQESVDKICEQIHEDGAKEVDSITGKARRTAEEIVSRAEAKARQAGERIVKDAVERGEMAKRRTLSSVSLEVRRIKLRAREEVVTAVMARVNGAVENARSRGDYADVLAALVAEAVRVLEGDAFVVHADRRDLALLESKSFPRIREIMKAEGRTVRSLEAKPLPGAVLGGAQVSVPGGNVIFDNTFEARLYRFREETRSFVFEEVFSSHDRIE
jgi:vacuolar-type H+-ATPase subunit E/Vma4